MYVMNKIHRWHNAEMETVQCPLISKGYTVRGGAGFSWPMINGPYRKTTTKLIFMQKNFATADCRHKKIPLLLFFSTKIENQFILWTPPTFFITHLAMWNGFAAEQCRSCGWWCSQGKRAVIRHGGWRVWRSKLWGPWEPFETAKKKEKIAKIPHRLRCGFQQFLG